MQHLSQTQLVSGGAAMKSYIEDPALELPSNV